MIAHAVTKEVEPPEDADWAFLDRVSVKLEDAEQERQSEYENGRALSNEQNLELLEPIAACESPVWS